MGQVLIVEDDHQLAILLQTYLTDVGHACDVVGSILEAKSLLAEREFDLAICDVELSGESGLDLVASIAMDLPQTATIMISGIDDFETGRASLELGALGYLVKPFSLSELEINVFAALRLKALEIDRTNLIAELERKIGDATGFMARLLEDLERGTSLSKEAGHEVATKLALALGLRDDETGEHIERVGRFCEAMGRQAGYPEGDLESLHHAAALHDIGKIGIPDAVLLKPGQLHPEEYRIIQRHAQLGSSYSPMAGVPILSSELMSPTLITSTGMDQVIRGAFIRMRFHIVSESFRSQMYSML